MISDDATIRIIWDRFDTYLDVGAVVRGRQIHSDRVVFLDRTHGIMAPIPAVTDHMIITPWPRTKRKIDLAQMTMSCRSAERRAAQALTATVAGGTAIDVTRECHVYFLSGPNDERTVHLPADIPIGDFVPGRGLASWSVRWADLRNARTCADLRPSRTESGGDD